MADALSSNIIKDRRGGKDLFNKQCLTYSHLTNAISQATSQSALMVAWQLYTIQAFPKEATQLSQLLLTRENNSVS